jgi:glycosyltransferase involved in cell wall biosynthesis
VIVPALNEEKRIGVCLGSIVHQSVCKQLIVVDNGSIDGTVPIAQDYADLVVKGRGYLGAVRNKGAQTAKGNIIAFIDADTIASSDWLATISHAFLDPALVAVTGPCLCVNKRRLHRWIFKARSTIRQCLIFLGVPDFSPANCAFRKDAFMRAGQFDESKAYCEDFRLSWRIHSIGKFSFNPKMTVHTSARRLDGQGSVRFIALGIRNALVTLLSMITL